MPDWKFQQRDCQRLYCKIVTLPSIFPVATFVLFLSPLLSSWPHPAQKPIFRLFRSPNPSSNSCHENKICAWQNSLFENLEKQNPISTMNIRLDSKIYSKSVIEIKTKLALKGKIKLLSDLWKRWISCLWSKKSNHIGKDQSIFKISLEYKTLLKWKIKKVKLLATSIADKNLVGFECKWYSNLKRKQIQTLGLTYIHYV